MKGRLVRWYDDKHYGFVQPDDGTADVFLHASNAPIDDLEIGWRLEFDTEVNPRNGKLHCVRVRLAA